MNTIVGFLRGINVGGHHKVPMAELRELLTQLGCTDVKTVLNSGNFICKTAEVDLAALESKVESALKSHFGFSIPLIVKSFSEIQALFELNPFGQVELHKDIRLYVTFLKHATDKPLDLPYVSADKTLSIIAFKNNILCSVFDLSLAPTPKGMDDLEKLFGKNVTTRNWNTIEKVLGLGLS